MTSGRMESRLEERGKREFLPKETKKGGRGRPKQIK